MHGENTCKLPIFAIVAGQPYTEIPTDLFIPPDALEVLIDSFSGPLDLLLYLIRKQNIDILDIPMTTITEQYLHYIQSIGESRIELAADYLVMAALLAEIKSRMLLPTTSEYDKEETEEDPRMALVRRLQAYEQFKEVALSIDALPRYERDVFPLQLQVYNEQLNKVRPEISLNALTTAMTDLMECHSHFAHHQISREVMSLRDKMNDIMQQLQTDKLTGFSNLFKRHEGRMGLVITLLAILELARQSLIMIIQANNFLDIHLLIAADG